MNRRGDTLAWLVLALALIGSATVAVVALLTVTERTPRAEDLPIPPVLSLVPAGQPIAAEAGVFQLDAASLAISDPATSRRPANPRSLHTFRLRRAFPGAPPMVPHGLTTRETLAGACNTCHERGGYSPRFGAYVPVTPHPELEECLQCHVADDATVGVTLPTADPNTICRQCHDPGAIRRPGVPPIEWSWWPRLSRAAPGDPPPVVPHDLFFRSNCLACHAGPGAVAELRTDHPDRANCRQCHVVGMEEAE